MSEIKVRMDCNGCVQKVKKALQGVTGIYDFCIDFQEQKITIVGWAEPVKIVKAIKKTRKSAMICSHTEQSDQSAEPSPEGGPEGSASEGGAPPPPPPESNSTPPQQPQAEGAPPADGQNEPPPPDNRNLPPEERPMPESSNEAANQSIQHVKPKDLEEIHVIYHHPPDYGYRYAYGHYHHHHQPGNGAQWNAYPSGPGIQAQAPQPSQSMYATHSYNTYRPSNTVTEYVYSQSAPGYSRYSQPNNYGQGGHYSGTGNGNGSITSMFSEENPNACCIV